MKLLFITGLYPPQQIENLTAQSRGRIQNAPNVFQWGFIEGLNDNHIDYEVISLPFLPSYPLNYMHLYTPSDNIYYNEQRIGEMLSYCDLLVYKAYSIRMACERGIKRWLDKNKYCEDKLVILTYTPYVPFLKAIRSIKKKYPNIIVASIVTDLVDNSLDFASNRSILKRIQCQIDIIETKSCYKYIDKYILLAQPMIEKIPEAIGKYIIIEGISTQRKSFKTKKATNLLSILYTGTLQEFSGVRQLLDAFMKIDNEHARLIICGTGYLNDKIKESAEIDKRIIYKGKVSREEALTLQKEATLLINPRRPDGDITRYSFPSKTMEYMSSGTPMIGYKLEGIPSEYYNYYYTIDDLSEEELIKTLEYVLALPISDLNTKADLAFDFVMTNKTAKIQLKKVIDFVQS